MIKVQEEDFSLTDEITFLKKRCNNIGALSTFIGIVRNKRENEKLVSMTLEHYPGMTEKMLNKINNEALKRWDLLDTTIIHRYGKLLPGEQIVLVITASKHRKEAIESLKKEIKKANEKENYLDEDERLLIKNFIIKIQKELDLK